MVINDKSCLRLSTLLLQWFIGDNNSPTFLDREGIVDEDIMFRHISRQAELIYEGELLRCRLEASSGKDFY